MIQEVYPHIFVNEIPLPDNPLKALNSYIICSEDRNIIVDTGFNLPACKEALSSGMKEAGIDPAKTLLVLTHMHPDHSGLAGDLQAEGMKVLIGEIDGKILNGWQKRFQENYQNTAELFDLEAAAIGTGLKEKAKPVGYTPLREGDKIALGDYLFEVIDIPGHTPGHIGLYERKHRVFLGGDHVLNQVTPNITIWGLDQDILATYLHSLEKVYRLEIDYLLPGHRHIITSHRARIDQLILHHKDRLEEIISILQSGEQSVRQIAAEMHWDLSDRWEEFTNLQKWFAAGEAMSHLEHLVAGGSAVRTLKNGTLFYRGVCTG
jgi:glyoxylase-like metal-dependent hydrolase (beta-lactamase superfamily II)